MTCALEEKDHLHLFPPNGEIREFFLVMSYFAQMNFCLIEVGEKD
jgi:hypothetical protein